MSTFVTKPDWAVYLRDQRLAQMTDQDDTLLDEVEETAIQIVMDHLYQWYETDTIFSTSGTDRPRNVLRWVMCLAVYFLYERIPDRMVPERVLKNYDDTMDMLKRVSDGKPSLSLPQRTEDRDGDGIEEPKTKFRGGSSSQRGGLY